MVQERRAVASHQCGPGSVPSVDAICGLSLCLGRYFALRGSPVFPSPQKPTFPNSSSTRNQVDQETLSFLFVICFLGGRLKSPNWIYPPSLHAFKNWWDKRNVAWFLRRQISDKICQFKKSRLSLFILDNRKWRSDEMTITASYGWEWSLLLFGGSSDGSYPHSKQ